MASREVCIACGFPVNPLTRKCTKCGAPSYQNPQNPNLVTPGVDTPETPSPLNVKNLATSGLKFVEESLGISKKEIGRLVLQLAADKDVRRAVLGGGESVRRSKFEKFVKAAMPLLIACMVFYMLILIFRAWCALNGVVL